MNEVEPPRGAAEAGDNPCLKISQWLCSVWGEQYDGFYAAGFESHSSAAMRREHLSGRVFFFLTEKSSVQKGRRGAGCLGQVHSLESAGVQGGGRGILMFLLL